jgi:hypothetical protein
MSDDVIGLQILWVIKGENSSIHFTIFKHV